MSFCHCNCRMCEAHFHVECASRRISKSLNTPHSKKVQLTSDTVDRNNESFSSVLLLFICVHNVLYYFGCVCLFLSLYVALPFLPYTLSVCYPCVSMYLLDHDQCGRQAAATTLTSFTLSLFCSALLCSDPLTMCK